MTLSSVGAGAFGAAFLVLLYKRVQSVKIVGTDIAHAVPLTLVAGFGHVYLGNVDFILLGGLVCGALPGIFLGAQLASSLPDRVIRPILGSSLLALGLKFSFS